MAMRDIVTRDLGWKLFSLVLAGVIWLTVKTVSDGTTPVANPLVAWQTRQLTNVPVFVVSAAGDVHDYKVKPSSVAVTVAGRPELLSELDEKELHVTVDLTDIESAVDLRKRIEVSAPPGVTIVSIAPQLADVVVPPKRSK